MDDTWVQISRALSMYARSILYNRFKYQKLFNVRNKLKQTCPCFFYTENTCPASFCFCGMKIPVLTLKQKQFFLWIENTCPAVLQPNS